MEQQVETVETTPEFTLETHEEQLLQEFGTLMSAEYNYIW